MKPDAAFGITPILVNGNANVPPFSFSFVSGSVNVINSPPTDITLNQNTVLENTSTAADLLVGQLSTVDLDPIDSYVYDLATGAGDADNAKFRIVNDKIYIKQGKVLDFEAKPSYSVRVRTADSGGLSFEKQYTINVTDVNENPTNIGLTNSLIAENAGVNAFVGTLSGTDPDAGDTLTFSLPSSTGNNSLFNINGTSLRANSSFDFESGSSYLITVRATDAMGLTFDKMFTISVTNVNESPVSLSLSANTIAENKSIGETVGAFSTVDPDLGNTFVYTLVVGSGSTDNVSFTVDTNGVLKTAAKFNFESKNSYSIRVRSTDQGNLNVEQVLNITVLDLLEMAALIQIGNGTAQRSVVNQLVVNFDNQVEIDLGAFVVQQRVKATDGSLQLNPVPAAYTLAPNGTGGMLATLTFSGPLTRAGTNALVDGNYMLTVDGSKVRIANTTRTLDADSDGVDGGFSSLGAVAADKFYALLGDANGNGEVDAQDILGSRNAFRARLGEANYNMAYDINGNGQIDSQDLIGIQNNFRKKRVFF